MINLEKLLQPRFIQIIIYTFLFYHPYNQDENTSKTRSETKNRSQGGDLVFQKKGESK